MGKLNSFSFQNRKQYEMEELHWLLKSYDKKLISLTPLKCSSQVPYKVSPGGGMRAEHGVTVMIHHGSSVHK